MKFTVKRILSILIVAVLIIMAGASVNVDYVSAQSIPEYIKIGLKYGSSSVNEYEVTFDNGIRLGVGDNDGFDELSVFEDINKVTICFQSEDIQLIGTKDSGETVIINENQEHINCIMPYDYEDGDTFTFQNSRYRGGIMFNSLSGGLTIINFLPIEEYLYGVINAELHKSNPIEALKAQAVAARSFAICKLGTHNLYGFDLCSTTHCQVYRGYNDEYPETIDAVDETRGETIKYEGKTVPAYFFKNSGGYTQSIEDVWGSKNFEYLKAVKDEHSPTYSWSKSFTFSELESKLDSAGFDIGDVIEVSITKRNQSGAVEELQFIGTNGTTTLHKSKIRSVLGATVIKSTMFTFGEFSSITNAVEEEEEDDDELNGYVLSESQASVTEIPEIVYVINNRGVISQSPTNDVYVYNGEDTKRISNMIQSDGDDDDINNQDLDIVESASDGNVTFTGLGYGHGIGMPQDSAVEMAKKDFTYEDIIKYYYTDITID